MNTYNLPKFGFLRLKDVLKVFPVSKTTWWDGVKTGRYPQPYKLSEKITAWKVSDIQELVETCIQSS